MSVVKQIRHPLKRYLRCEIVQEPCRHNVFRVVPYRSEYQSLRGREFRSVDAALAAIRELIPLPLNANAPNKGASTARPNSQTTSQKERNRRGRRHE